MALDKSKLVVKLDLKNKQVLEAPDNRLQMTDVTMQENGTTGISLSVIGITPEDRFLYTIVEEPARDAEGRELRFGDRRTFSNAGEQVQQTEFELLSDGPLAGPVTFAVNNYPSWIEEPFRVKLK